MSGVSGSDRISRDQFDVVLKDYESKVLKLIPGYKSISVSGSYNSDLSKQDFGDMDLIVQFDTPLSKKDLKMLMVNFFNTLPHNVVLPFTSEKYAGKRTYNSGEIVTINYPQGNGKSVQIDNIISLSDTETTFKQKFLDMPANKQGLILGLIKVAVQIEDNIEDRLGINFPSISTDEVYEFNLSSVELQLRGVEYKMIDSKFKQYGKEVLWRTRDWDFVVKLLDKYNLDTSFEDLLEQVKELVKDTRARTRIVGVFKTMITVKSGEVGTQKGQDKIDSIKLIETLV
jgi:hypothetical protein